MLTEEQIIRLQDVGFAACHSGAVYEARKIFDGLLLLRPGNAPILIGLALSHIVVDDFEVAEHILRDQVLTKHPDDADAQIMLGLCYILCGRHDEARVILSKTVDHQSSYGQLTQDLLKGLG